jgi:hypothetical protein
MTTETKTKTPAAMTAWEMACSLLVGLYKAEAQAKSEYLARLAEVGGKPFGVGVTPAAHTLEALSEARRNLDHDLRGIARANRFPLPEIKL